MGIFERYLSVWVALAIACGVAIGAMLPKVFSWISGLEVAHINLPVAVLIWLMIYPMMVQIDWSAIKDVGKKPKGLALTIVVNWLIKPFTMALVGWLFFRVFFCELGRCAIGNRIHCRHDFVGRGTVYGDGVRVVAVG